LIESKNIFKNKNEQKKNTYFFQLINNRHVVLSNANNNSSKNFEIIDEMSKSNCFTSNNFEKNAKILIVKNAQNFLKRKKIVAIVKKILKEIFFSNHRLEISKTFRERFDSKTSRTAKILLRKIK
jgi:hypothetical protein